MILQAPSMSSLGPKVVLHFHWHVERFGHSQRCWKSWTFAVALRDGSMVCGHLAWFRCWKHHHPYYPWDWYIYLHEWLVSMANVGKYAIHGSERSSKLRVGQEMQAPDVSQESNNFPIEDVSILGWSSIEVISFSLATDFQAHRISMGRLYIYIYLAKNLIIWQTSWAFWLGRWCGKRFVGFNTAYYEGRVRIRNALSLEFQKVDVFVSDFFWNPGYSGIPSQNTNSCLEPQGQPFINGCFNWMIPNLYIENGCFTKHPFINGCSGF